MKSAFHGGDFNGRSGRIGFTANEELEPGEHAYHGGTPIATRPAALTNSGKNSKVARTGQAKLASGGFRVNDNIPANSLVRRLAGARGENFVVERQRRPFDVSAIFRKL